MKMKPEDLETLKNLFNTHADLIPSPELVQKYKQGGHGPNQVNFDALYQLKQRTRSPFIPGLYRYLNDAHIATALKHIFK